MSRFVRPLAAILVVAGCDRTPSDVGLTPAAPATLRVTLAPSELAVSSGGRVAIVRVDARMEPTALTTG